MTYPDLFLTVDSWHGTPVAAPRGRIGLSVWRRIGHTKVTIYSGPTNDFSSENELRQVRDAWPYPNN